MGIARQCVAIARHGAVSAPSMVVDCISADKFTAISVMGDKKTGKNLKKTFFRTNVAQRSPGVCSGWHKQMSKSRGADFFHHIVSQCVTAIGTVVRTAIFARTICADIIISGYDFLRKHCARQCGMQSGDAKARVHKKTNGDCANTAPVPILTLVCYEKFERIETSQFLFCLTKHDVVII